LAWRAILGGEMANIGLRQRLFFYLVFTSLIILAILMLKPYFTVLVVSLISLILLKPLYNWFLGRKRVKERKRLATSMTLLAVLVILVVPVIVLIWVTLSQMSGLFEQLAALDFDAIIQDIQHFLAGLPLVGDIQPTDTNVTEGARPLMRAVAQALTNLIVSLSSSIPGLIIQGIIFIVVVATVLPVYDDLVPKLEEISPLGPELSELYTRKITAMVKSLVLGVFLVALIQGAAMGFFYWLAGLPYIFLLVVLSMMLALIPLVGISWLVIAIAIISFLTGNWVQGLVVLFGFYGVVNWIDILLRPKLLSKEASINFALFMLAIFGGVAWAGIMGLFYGPVIMLLLVTTIDIYAEQYANEDKGLLDQALSRLGSDRGAKSAKRTEPTSSGNKEIHVEQGIP
jgi:predicted PurR-regulated permease PerM